MNKKKFMAVLIAVVTCCSLLLLTINTFAVSESVTALSTYDPAAKTVTISGTATSEQVVIKIILEGKTTPDYFGYASVVDNKYSIIRSWSTFTAGNYNVIVENSDDGNTVQTTFSTIDNSTAVAAINAIKGYADTNNANALTIIQLKNAGVTGTVDANLDAYKSKIASLNASDVDTVSKIQSVISLVNTEESANHSNSVTVLATYNSAAKTVAITGTANCKQVAIKINYVGETTPVWYGSCDVINGQYSLTRPVSTYKIGEYIVSVENTDNAVSVYDKFTIIIVDNTAPIITIGDYTKNPTNKSIVVTATTNEGTLNVNNHTFDENGSFEFVATDAAGNVSKATVNITNIDKIAPIITLGNYLTTPTNKSIIITATTNEGTLNSDSHTFSTNGSFSFIATDAAGNSTTLTVDIKNIDTKAPVITVGEYVKEATNKDITVTVATDEGTLNASSHTFTENGSFDFTATDNAGNTTTLTVIITNIDKTAPIITIGDYTKDPTNKEIVVTAATNEGTLNAESHTFIENGSFEFTATDAAGNVTTETVTITNINMDTSEVSDTSEDSETPDTTDDILYWLMFICLSLVPIVIIQKKK